MNWAEQLAATLGEVIGRLRTEVVELLPKLLGMLLILGLGFLIALLVARIGAALLRRVGFDRAAERAGLRGMLERANIRVGASGMVGKLIFWLVMLTFVISAADALGLDNVSQTVDTFVTYLPRVFGAIIIAVGGLLVAGFARDLVRGGTERIGVEYARALSQLAYGVLLILVVSLAIGQLGLETDLINRVIEFSVLGAGAAVALSLALGTRDVTKHVVAGAYARDVYKPGMRLEVGTDVGHLVEVGTVSARITTESGETVFIPNGHLIDSIVRGSSEPRAAS